MRGILNTIIVACNPLLGLATAVAGFVTAPRRGTGGKAGAPVDANPDLAGSAPKVPWSPPGRRRAAGLAQCITVLMPRPGAAAPIANGGSGPTPGNIQGDTLPTGAACTRVVEAAETTATPVRAAPDDGRAARPPWFKMPSRLLDDPRMRGRPIKVLGAISARVNRATGRARVGEATIARDVGFKDRTHVPRETKRLVEWGYVRVFPPDRSRGRTVNEYEVIFDGGEGRVLTDSSITWDSTRESPTTLGVESRATREQSRLTESGTESAPFAALGRWRATRSDGEGSSGAALSLEFDLPEDWLHEAQSARLEAQLPAVNLQAAWTKFRHHNSGRLRTRGQCRERWISWAVDERASPRIEVYGPAEARSPGRSESFSPAQPSPPLEHQLGEAGDRLMQRIGATAFRSWFGQVRSEGERDGVLHLSAPTRFIANRIAQHYGEQIRAAWRVELIHVGRRDGPKAGPMEPTTTDASAQGEPPRSGGYVGSAASGYTAPAAAAPLESKAAKRKAWLHSLSAWVGVGALTGNLDAQMAAWEIIGAALEGKRLDGDQQRELERLDKLMRRSRLRSEDDKNGRSE